MKGWMDVGGISSSVNSPLDHVEESPTTRDKTILRKAETEYVKGLNVSSASDNQDMVT